MSTTLTIPDFTFISRRRAQRDNQVRLAPAPGICPLLSRHWLPTGRLHLTTLRALTPTSALPACRAWLRVNSPGVRANSTVRRALVKSLRHWRIRLSPRLVQALDPK
eukprot:2506195-Pyramimonas_sp.AAC.1